MIDSEFPSPKSIKSKVTIDLLRYVNSNIDTTKISKKLESFKSSNISDLKEEIRPLYLVGEGIFFVKII